MIIFNPATCEGISDLIATLTRFDEAGIDSAFDAECEELERQFAELRLAHEHN